MAIGPVQLIVLGFSHPEFHGEIIAELEKLRESDTVRVIDALAVHKDADGEIEVAHLSDLSKDEAIELGSKVGALIGLGIEGEEGMEAGAVAGAITGRCRCATRSLGPAASGWPTASSARSTWSKSDWFRPLRPSSSTRWRRTRARRPDRSSVDERRRFIMMGSRRVARRTSRRVARRR